VTEVWLFREEEWPALDGGILPDAERAAVERYRFEDDRRRTAGGRILCRRLLSEHLGVAPESLCFRTGEYGKPALTEGSLEFNVTHSGAWIGLAIGDSAVGIDIEQIKPDRDVEGLGRRYFLPHERVWIAAQADQTLAFFRIWSMKESALKADGRGLALPLGDVVLHPEARIATIHSTRWMLTELHFDEGYTGCVASQEEEPVVHHRATENAEEHRDPL
jgi:4'-phosphopantetheinyl transferase